MSARFALALGAVLMFFAVALGAFGAHALKSRLAPDLQAVWQTAVTYHAWHALGITGIGVLLNQSPERSSAALAAWLLLLGIVLFSGSLYAMALTNVKALGAVTPFGGAAFLAGWLALAWSAWKG